MLDVDQAAELHRLRLSRAGGEDVLQVVEREVGSSGYCTATKYWLPLLGSIQKLRVSATLEFIAVTTCMITSRADRPTLRRLLAVHLENQVRGVVPLQDADVGRAATPATVRWITLGRSRSLLWRAAVDLDVDRRRAAEVQRRRDHAAGVETRRPGRRTRRRHAIACRSLTAYCWAVIDSLFGELDADDGVLLAGVRRVGARPVRVQADLGDDHLAFVLGDLLLDEFLQPR